MKTYIGIDPGSKGYIVCLDSEGGFFESLPIEDSTQQDIATFLNNANYDNKAVCVMEDVHAMPGQGVASTFAFGRNTGFLFGLLVAFKIPYTLVSPQKWQKAMWIAADHVTTTATDKNGNTKKVVMPKPTSINAATRLFPDVDLRKNRGCKKPHDGKCDALLMALYAKRMNL